MVMPIVISMIMIKSYGFMSNGNIKCRSLVLSNRFLKISRKTTRKIKKGLGGRTYTRHTRTKK